jgi:hypothetical protein
MNTKITTAKRIAATLGAALALNAALVANPASAVVAPTTPPTTPQTTTTTVVTNSGISARITYTDKITRTVSADNFVTPLAFPEGQWCKTWGEGQYRIRNFKLNYVLAPEDRNRPVPEGSFGFPTRQVVQAQVLHCQLTPNGFVANPVSAQGLRIDVEVPVYLKGRPWGYRIIRNVVTNWSDSVFHFEGEIPAVMQRLPVGSYTVSAVSTQYPADIAKLTFTIFPGPR